MRTWAWSVRARLSATLPVLGLVALVYGIAVPDAHATPPPSPPPGPTITISDASATESSCGTANAVFTVQLSRTSSMIVSVRYATADGIATAGADYQAQSGTLTFQPKERTKSIVVPILSDQITEAAETFVVNLRTASNGTIGEGQGTGTILNDLCDDGDSCTVDGCDPSTATHTCRHTAVSCDDHNICTTDTCSAGACQHQAVDLGQTSCGVGTCQRTVSICLNGVPQTCTPGTPTAEICNGLDDDCNGVVDGPGAESSCHLANASAQCVGGACAIATCNAGFDNCDGNPADGCETPLNTLTNCGACGTACARDNASASCSSGSCTIASCNPGFDNCDANPANGCETPLNTVTDCGSCGTACSRPNASASCSNGTCQLSTCNSGFDNCDANPANGCETPLNTLTNCGACGTACTRDHASASCSTGSCTIGSCNPGFDNCDGDLANGCESPLNTLTNCGSCGTACSRPNTSASCSTGSCTIGSCNAGFDNCDGSDANGCETPLNTLTDCGSCGIACSRPNASASCSTSSCTISSCNPGFDNCDGNSANGCEANISTNTSNCGACGNACSFPNASASCSGGACQLGACNGGFGNCDGNAADGCETDLNSNTSNCGTCGNACSFPNASGLCSGGACALGACNPGFGDCDGDPADGCEIDLLSDTSHCGSCGQVCSLFNATAVCNAGSCDIAACVAGFQNCDGSPGNGCETSLTDNPANCGGCGSSCDDANACTVDACVAASCTHTTMSCDDGNACTVDSCNPLSGTCVHTPGNAGTVCRAAVGACDLAESCTGTSATCPANIFVLNGTACRAAAGACDQNDTCQNGTCPDQKFPFGSICGSAAGPCDAADHCDGVSNNCVDVKVAAGTVCRAAAGPCDAADFCDGVSNNCSDGKAADGTACTDDNPCSQVDTCQSGVCTGGVFINCFVAPDQCHDTGTCLPATGRCSYPVKPNGSACSDDNACSQVDTCQSGVCTGSSFVSCTASNECQLDGTCDPTTGLCSNPAKPDNSLCSGGACCNGSCTNVNMAQSTSPTNLYPDSVKAGYQAVSEIANCGACGNNCGGPTACITTLCVPGNNGLGQCRSYSRYQCYGARCSGLPPNSLPELVEPECASPNDADHDGLPVEWETLQPDPYSPDPSRLQTAAGIDLNCDGEISPDADLIWHEPPAGDSRKDIYLELDYMGQEGFINDPVLGRIPEPFNHFPPTDPATGKTALEEVKTAFNKGGVTLHIDPVVEVVPHHQIIFLGGTSYAGTCNVVLDPTTGEPAADFYSLKEPNFDPRRRIGYHYVISGHNSCSDFTEASAGHAPTDGSGTAEIGGNDMIISLASGAYYRPQFCVDRNADGSPDPVSCCSPTDCCIGDESNWAAGCGTVLPSQSTPYSCEGASGYEVCVSNADKLRRFREWAGTLMHELGHNLGLCHDGLANIGLEDSCAGEAGPYNPNHISSMNFLFQMRGIMNLPKPPADPPDPVQGVRVDFSHYLQAITEFSLDESNLDEAAKLGITTFPWDRDMTIYYCPSGEVRFARVDTSIDWNCDGQSEQGVMADINGDGLMSTIPQPPDEWGNLFLQFTCTPSVQD